MIRAVATGFGTTVGAMLGFVLVWRALDLEGSA